MSWQVYIDQNLLGTQAIAKAAILGQQGGIWAISSGYQITPEEQQALISAFHDASQAQASGIRVNGVKFFTLTANERSLYGKKGGDGIIVVKTVQAIIVGEYTAPTQPGTATKIVEDLADYLISVGC